MDYRTIIPLLCKYLVYAQYPDLHKHSVLIGKYRTLLFIKEKDYIRSSTFGLNVICPQINVRNFISAQDKPCTFKEPGQII